MYEFTVEDYIFAAKIGKYNEQGRAVISEEEAASEPEWDELFEQMTRERETNGKKLKQG